MDPLQIARDLFERRGKYFSFLVGDAPARFKLDCDKDSIQVTIPTWAIIIGAVGLWLAWLIGE